VTIAVIVRRTAPVAVITNPDASAVKFFRDQAEGSATDAAGSATTASTAATTATTQAGIATTAATTATTQAGIATTQAGIATTGAATATTQAGIATTGASTATTQATTAETHATAAIAAAASIANVAGFATNASWTNVSTSYDVAFTGSGLSDRRMAASTGSPTATIAIPAVANGDWITLYYRVDPAGTGSRPSIMLRTSGNSGAASDSYGLLRTGDWYAQEIQATAAAALLRVGTTSTGASDNSFQMFPVVGRATDTNQSTPQTLMHALARARMASDPWSGLVTGLAAGGSFTVNAQTLTSVDVTNTNPSGSIQLTIPIRTVPTGSSLTLVYMIESGNTGSVPSVLLLQNAGTAASTPLTALTADGAPHTLTMTATADAVNIGVRVTNAAAAFKLHYAVLPYNKGDTALESLPLALLGLADVFGQPAVDVSVRNLGVITGPSVNVSFDSHTAIGFYGFEAYKTNGTNGNAYWAYFPTRAVANGEKYTLIYRVSPRTGEAKVIGTVKARWYNSGSKSNLATLTADGMFHVQEFTATGAATQFYVEVDNTSADLHFEGFMIQGQASDTTLSFGLGGYLLAMANVLNSSFTNLVSERWVASQKQIMLGPVFGFEGRHVTFYTRQLLVARQRSRTIDVGLISQPDTQPYAYVGTPGAGYDVEEAIADFSAVARLPVDTLAARSYLTAQVLDSADTTHPLTRTVPFHAAAATGGSGSVMVVNLGDSYGAIYRPHIRELVNMTGFTWAGVGTIGSGADKNQAVSGYSTNDWMGRRTTDLTLAGNPFLRAADPAGADSDWQDVCMAIGGTEGSSLRWPNYVEDATQADYYILDWDTWRQNGAVALAGTEKLTLFVTLWVNDAADGYTDWLTLLDQNYERIVTNFLETFPNGRVLIALPGVSGNGNNGNVNWAELSGAALAILNRFRDREAEQIYVLPTWAMMSCDLNQNTSTLSSTDTATGTETRTITDFVHARDFMQRQFAEPVAAAVCWLAETYGV
jgi:hypothetical protein